MNSCATAAGARGWSTSVRWTRRGAESRICGRARQCGGEGEGQGRQSMTCGNKPPEAVHIGSAVREVRAEPVGVGGGAQLIEGNSGVGGVDPVGVGEVEEAQGAPACQRVAGGEEDGEGLLGHGQAGHRPRVGHRQRVAGAAAPSIRPRSAAPVSTACATAARPSTWTSTARPGVAGAQTGQVPGDGGREGRGTADQGQPGGVRPPDPGDIGTGRVDAEQQRGGVFHEPFARRCWPYGAALHQPGTEIVLQGGDVLRHGGLGVAQCLGGGGEGAVFDDSDEGTQQMRIHEHQYC